MTSEYRASITCDDCRAPGPSVEIGGRVQGSARLDVLLDLARRAVADGWELTEYRDRCPPCAAPAVSTPEYSGTTSATTRDQE